MNFEMPHCVVCGKRLTATTRRWSILTGKYYCPEHCPLKVGV